MSIDIWATKDLELRPLSEGNLVCDPAPCQGSCRRELGRWKGCKFLDMRLWHDASCIYHADVWNVGHERQILQCPSNTTWPWLSRDLTVITLCGLSCVTLPFLREISRRPGCLSICFTAVFLKPKELDIDIVVETKQSTQHIFKRKFLRTKQPQSLNGWISCPGNCFSWAFKVIFFPSLVVPRKDVWHS